MNGFTGRFEGEMKAPEGTEVFAIHPVQEIIDVEEEMARLFEDAGIWRWKKHTSIVTPRDFYEELEKEEIFEGPLYELVYPKATVWRKVYEQ